jgi:hypothetical protein
MGFGKTISACALLIVGIIGGTMYYLSPQMTAGSQVAMVGAATVVVGLPLFALAVNWWVNQSVYRDATRRPSEYEH